MRALLAIALLTATATAQWQLQQSHTTASLRGIHALGNGVAWASGTGGTVLRTTDDGATWQPCAIPPDAEHLDFRGVQAFDAKTAIVMSSGKGDLSRLYKTTDACLTWKLVFTNPDKEGFWNAVKFPNQNLGFILGDPVAFSKPTSITAFPLFITENGGANFKRSSFESNEANAATHGAFAASNTALFVGWPFIFFGSGGTAGPSIYLDAFQQHISYKDAHIDLDAGEWRSNRWSVPLASGQSAGIFSVAFQRSEQIRTGEYGTSTLPTLMGIVIGGDYLKPDSQAGTAAFTKDGGQTWTASTTPPHGYRSAVAYSPTHKAWITIGPNGTDLSTDDGRNWRPLKPTAPNADPEEDQHWNALSLPFVVGPKGRIGKLREDAIPH